MNFPTTVVPAFKTAFRCSASAEAVAVSAVAGEDLVHHRFVVFWRGCRRLVGNRVCRTGAIRDALTLRTCHGLSGLQNDRQIAHPDSELVEDLHGLVGLHAVWCGHGGLVCMAAFLQR